MNEVRRPKIGLALGSGGAMGLAQIGILKILKENGIRIDYIAGTSIGSVVGAYYALNEDIVGLEKAFRSLTKKELLRLMDLVSPSKGLVEGKRVMKFLIDLIGDKDFSETKIPLRIVATDIDAGKEFLFERGKIGEAIQASISMPGIFRLAPIGGKFYLDGGIVNPTPVDVAKDMGADLVIAIDHTVADFSKITNPSAINVLKRAFEIIRTNTAKIKLAEEDENVLVIPVRKSRIDETFDFYNKEHIDKGIKIAEEYLVRIDEFIRDWKIRQSSGKN